MRFIKRVLPLLLAALILIGGICGGYALRSAIPSYKGTVVEAERSQGENPLLLIDSEETITFSPWDQYDPQKSQNYTSFLASSGVYEGEQDFTYPLSVLVETAYTYLYYVDGSGSVEMEKDSGLTEALESVLSASLRVQIIEGVHYYYLPETKITAAGEEYYVKAAIAGYDTLLYFTCRKTSESEDSGRFSSEKLQKAASDVNSYFNEIQSFGEELGISEDEALEPYGYGDEAFWLDYFFKTAPDNPLARLGLQNTLRLNTYNLSLMVFSKKDVLAYQDQILVVFSSPEFYMEPGYTPRSLILFYDPAEKVFTGFSSEA